MQARESFQIREVRASDVAGICETYNHYILNSTATFEVTPVTEADMTARIAATTEQYPWLVAIDHNQVLGYAYATGWKPREAYRQTAESTVYLQPDATGRGVGSDLMTQLLEQLRNLEIHAVLAGIALPNPASVAVHERLGFSQVAHFRQTGRKFDQWVDVGYWEMVLQAQD